MNYQGPIVLIELFVLSDNHCDLRVPFVFLQVGCGHDLCRCIDRFYGGSWFLNQHWISHIRALCIWGKHLSKSLHWCSQNILLQSFPFPRLENYKCWLIVKCTWANFSASLFKQTPYLIQILFRVYVQFWLVFIKDFFCWGFLRKNYGLKMSCHLIYFSL